MWTRHVVEHEEQFLSMTILPAPHDGIFRDLLTCLWIVLTPLYFLFEVREILFYGNIVLVRKENIPIYHTKIAVMKQHHETKIQFSIM